MPITDINTASAKSLLHVGVQGRNNLDALRGDIALLCRMLAEVQSVCIPVAQFIFDTNINVDMAVAALAVAEQAMRKMLAQCAKGLAPCPVIMAHPITALHEAHNLCAKHITSLFTHTITVFVRIRTDGHAGWTKVSAHEKISPDKIFARIERRAKTRSPFCFSRETSVFTTVVVMRQRSGIRPQNACMRRQSTTAKGLLASLPSITSRLFGTLGVSVAEKMVTNVTTTHIGLYGIDVAHGDVVAHFDDAREKNMAVYVVTGISPRAIQIKLVHTNFPSQTGIAEADVPMADFLRHYGAIFDVVQVHVGRGCVGNHLLGN